MLIGIHGTIFVFTRIGAKVSFIDVFNAMARSFNVVTDPLMGWISDKTKTKHAPLNSEFKSGESTSP
jgi:Na+/melibiose symporter-like transporter